MGERSLALSGAEIAVAGEAEKLQSRRPYPQRGWPLAGGGPVVQYPKLLHSLGVLLPSEVL